MSTAPNSADNASTSLSSTSQSKISGLKAPSKLTRPTGIQRPTSSLPGPAATASVKSFPSNSTINNETTSTEFKVGDACWVNGTKAGVVAFVGETQFKEGEWAGVVLETNDGKNDGSLNGVTYFVTEPNRGIFCRLNKLTREPQVVSEESFSVQKPVVNESGLVVGMRVLITSATGSKVGVLRYLGTTEFAKGEWAGVELDEKMGKNDGSVSDKRYFTCKPMFGVFAPVAKVSPYEKRVTSTPANQVRGSRVSSLQASAKSTNLAKKTLNKQMSGSQESINSMSQYSATGSGVRSQKIGIMSKIGNQTPNLSTLVAKKQASNTPVLQALKEKELHIEQLLKERDFERAEFTRAAQKFEQTEQALLEYTKSLEERDSEIARLTDTVTNLTEQTTSLTAQLDTENTRIEDLEFQIEEHKLGCVESDEAVSVTPVEATLSTGQDDILIRLQSQQEACKKHLDESKGLKEQVEALKIDLKQLKLGEEVYAKDKSDLQKTIEGLEGQVKEASTKSAEHAKLLEQFKELTDQHKQLDSERNELNAKLTELTTLRTQLEFSENQKAEFEFQFQEENAKCNELTNKLTELQIMLNERNQEIVAHKESQGQGETDLEFALEEQKVLVQELESKLTLKTNECDEIKTRQDLALANGDEANKKLQLQLDEINANQAKAATDLAEKNEFIKSLEDQLEALNKAKESELELAKQETSRVITEAESSSKQYTESQQLVENYEKQIEELKNDLETHKKDSLSQDDNLSARQAELDNLKQKKDAEIEELNKSLETLKSELSVQLNEKTLALEKANKEFEDFKNQKDQELNGMKSEAAKTKEQDEDTMKEMQDQVTALNAQVEESKKSNNELQARIAEMITNSGDYSSQLTALNEKLVEKEKLIEETQNLLSKAQQEVVRFTEQITDLNENFEDEKQKWVEVRLELENEKLSLSSKLTSETEKHNQYILEITDKEKCIKNNETDLEKFRLEIENLNEQIVKEKKTSFDTQTNLDDSVKKIENLSEELSKMRTDLDLASTKITALETELKIKTTLAQTLTDTLDAEKQKLENLTKQIEEKQADALNQEKSKTAEIDEAKNIYEKEAANLKEQIQNLNKEIEANSNSIKSMTEENVMLKGLKESMIVEKERLGQEKDRIIAESQEDLKKTVAKMSGLEEEKVTLKNEITALKSKVEISEKAQQQCLSDNEQRASELKTLQAEIESAKAIHTSLTSEKEALVTEKDGLAKELEALKTTQKELQTQKNSIEAENQKLKESLASSNSSNDGQLESLRTELEEANKNVTRLDEIQKENFVKIKNLEEMIQENESSNEAKKNELIEMKSQIEMYEVEINKASDTILLLESENEHLTAQNAALQDENQELQENLAYSEDSSLPNANNSTSEPASKPKTTTKLAPRLFCDICDQFDLHETEDCPQQLMPDNQDDKSLHSKFDGKKIVIRAYCDLCEQFGHEEVDCNNKVDEKAPSDEEF